VPELQASSMPPVLYMAVALLIGLYIGISLSSFSQGPSSTSSLHAANDLRKVQSEMQQWKKRFEKLGQEYAQAVDKVKKLEAQVGDCSKLQPNLPEGRAAVSVHSSNLPNPNSHPVCQKLPYPAPSATSLWHQHINSILQATKLPNDPRFKFHDFTAQVLQLISPRLPRSVKSLPYDWASVEQALTIGWERYQYLQLPKIQQAAVNSPPRPVKILLMGGSLLVGTNCRKLLSELKLSFRLPKRDCTWSNRLGQFLNAWAGGELVEVTKVAMGGTNTATGSVILQYDLIPEDARNPDIVFNAYSTNDMHILTVMEAQSSNTTLRDMVFEMTQSFVRQVLQSCSKKNPPLLLHIDDYLGNEQRAIWDTTELSQGVQVLANYYGFSTMSFSDTVRDIVYGDTLESWLSPDWWGTGKFEREIHPGMGMHISATWVAVYNMLNLVTTYCSLPDPHVVDSTEYRPGVMGLPELNNDVAQAKGKPQQRPSGLPPRLTQNLLIEDVTALWKHSQDEVACDSQEQHHHEVKCPFSWISGLSLQQNNQTWIKEYFQRRASLWEGWQISDDGGKLGLVPTNGTTSQLVLDFSFSQPIRAVTFFIMKSYGEKWEGSRLEVRLKSQEQSNVWKDIQVREMVGFHGKNTSEMYTEAFKLSQPIPVGSSLRLGAKLVGGTTFKLLGLAVCS
jgi:lysophospholipase L1-like esterase